MRISPYIKEFSQLQSAQINLSELISQLEQVKFEDELTSSSFLQISDDLQNCGPKDFDLIVRDTRKLGDPLLSTLLLSKLEKLDHKAVIGNYFEGDFIGCKYASFLWMTDNGVPAITATKIICTDSGCTVSDAYMNKTKKVYKENTGLITQDEKYQLIKFIRGPAFQVDTIARLFRSIYNNMDEFNRNKFTSELNFTFDNPDLPISTMHNLRKIIHELVLELVPGMSKLNFDPFYVLQEKKTGKLSDRIYLDVEAAELELNLKRDSDKVAGISRF